MVILQRDLKDAATGIKLEAKSSCRNGSARIIYLLHTSLIIELKIFN